MKKFLSLPEEATNKPNYNKRFGLNQSNSKIKNNLTDCLMRFLFFSRATFFRRCLQRAVLVVFLFFITPLISCIDSEGNLSYNIKVNAQDFIIEDTTDYSNIEKLWEQPLRVIQKAVYGEWQVLEWKLATAHWPNTKTYSNTFAKITRDSIIVTLGESEYLPSLFPPFSYKWEPRYGTHLMVWKVWVDEEYGECEDGLILRSISGDTLHFHDIHYSCYYKFLRVK